MATTETQSYRRWGGVATGSTSASDTHRRSSPFVLTAPDGRKSLIVFVLAAFALFLADVALLWLHPGTYHIDVGNYRDSFFLQGTHFQEVAPDGGTYRWTRESSTLWLAQTNIAPHTLLTLDLGGRPESGEVRLTLNERPWVAITAQPAARRYAFLLPADLPGEITVGMHSETFSTTGDPRRLGIKLEGVFLTVPATGPPLPTPAHYLAQVLVILAVQASAIRLGWRWRIQAALVGVLVLVLAAVLSALLLMAYVYIQRMAIAACGLAALTWVVLPIAERKLAWVGDSREIRLLWAIMLVSCVIRFVGVFYPTFGAQDLGRNLNRLMLTIRGELVIIAWSGEFADGDTIYPPGPYLAVMPGLTLSDDRGALLQGTLAFLDGTTAFFVALLTRRLGGNRHAARLAMLLYMSNIAVFGAMTYGFSAQIFGQWFTAPLALVLLAPGALMSPQRWAGTIVLLLFGVLSHIGVAILGITWVGVMLGLLILSRQWSRGMWWGLALFVGSVLLAFGLLYIHIFATTVGHVATVAEEPENFALRGNTALLWKGMRLAYSVVGLALVPLGLLLLARARRDWLSMIVPLAWVLTTLLYFAVDLVTALQVRYFYFSLPLAAAAAAILLGRLSIRGRWGQVIAWALVLALAIPNVLLWYSATMASGKISMTPLTH